MRELKESEKRILEILKDLVSWCEINNFIDKTIIYANGEQMIELEIKTKAIKLKRFEVK